jgi:hypothetical protein
MNDKVVFFGVEENERNPIMRPHGKPTKHRAITQKANWMLDVSIEKQLNVILSLFNNNNCEGIEEENVTNTNVTNADTNTNAVDVLTTHINSQINHKLNSYKHQDIHNNKYNADLFITFDKVVKLLYESKLCCYYCSNLVKILYDAVRDPTQWTLERIDNSRGHNCDNLVISCLNCNLRRRTMFYQRYLFTKQIGKQSIIKESAI